MSLAFNYRHLYYFWVVAKEGGMARAADRLDMAVQTVSAQVHELERALGHALFKPAGRGLALTDAGAAALAQADQIFALGELLPDKVREAGHAPQLRLAMGISDGLPKLVVQHLMQPVLDEPRLRLLCHEDEFERLLADLALHKLDAVLADRPAPPHPNLKLYSHALGQSAMAWYAGAELARDAAKDFPRCLARVPVLLPTGHAVVRARLDAWFDHHGVRPRVVGEFEDSALLKTFGAAGLGVFPAPEVVQADLLQRYRVRRIGAAEGVAEQFFVIGTEKKVQHPLVQRLLPGR
ncbi:transcriptional regulator [Burkholderiales bacterium JOSHI_001]|nr:transcriptional regulator [Burkholderiales bacterium JOSHI_001]